MHGALAGVILAAAVSIPAPNWVGRFSGEGAPPAPWKMVNLPGERPTRYLVANVSGKVALEAIVDRSMSLLARPISVDLAKTPVLCWRWYVDGPVRKADMTKRSGDDYAARVYVAFDMGQTTRFRHRRSCE